MNAKHTPGKLIADCNRPFDDYQTGNPMIGTAGLWIAELCVGKGYDQTDEQAEANAERLAACWNACDGLPDPSVVPKLIAALKAAESTIRWAAQESAGRVKAEIVGGWLHHADQARAALAEGGAT